MARAHSLAAFRLQSLGAPLQLLLELEYGDFLRLRFDLNGQVKAVPAFGKISQIDEVVMRARGLGPCQPSIGLEM